MSISQGITITLTARNLNRLGPNLSSMYIFLGLILLGEIFALYIRTRKAINFDCISASRFSGPL